MSLPETCQAALAAVQRARALFSSAPVAPESADTLSSDLDRAQQLTHTAGSAMSAQSGSMASNYHGFAQDEEARLGEAHRTDRALVRLVRESAAVTSTGASQLDGIVASTRAIVEAAPGARTAAEQRMIVHALYGQVSHAQRVVQDTFRRSDELASDIRMLGYGSGQLSPGLDPPPPPPLPPPLAPVPDDDPWTHGGDRRWSSVASAGIKQKILAAALLEMDRNGQRTAMRMLQHYLDNEGTPEQLDPDLVDRWLADPVNGYGPADPASPPAALVRSNLSSITTEALRQARQTGRTVTLTGNTPWAVVANSDGDAVRTLGHYSASTAYRVTMNPDGTYSMSYRHDLSDWYNFATTHPMPWDLAHNVANAAHDLQAAGYAQDFPITGSGHVQTLQGVAR